jgi:hypothetical protein
LYPDPVSGPEQLTLSDLQAVNAPSDALSAMAEHRQDEVFVALVAKIRAQISSSAARSIPRPPAPSPRPMPARQPAAPRSPVSRYSLLREVYRGHYSRVERCRDLETGEICIVKRTRADLVSLPALQALMDVDCEAIARPSRIWFEDGAVCEELPEVGGTRLSDAIVRDAGGLTGVVLEVFLDQMMEALHSLHRGGLIHRDVHPDNIFLLYERDGERVASPGAAASNFKLVRFVLVDCTFVALAADAGRLAPVAHGSFTPPEQVAGSPVPASDIYALGATIHHGILGKEIPEAAARVRDPACLGELPDGKHASIEFPEFLREMLDLDPAARPRFNWLQKNSVVAQFTGAMLLKNPRAVLLCDRFADRVTAVTRERGVDRLKQELDRIRHALSSPYPGVRDETIRTIKALELVLARLES